MVPADDPEFLEKILTEMEDDIVFREQIYERCMSGDLTWLYTTPQLKIRHALLTFDESLTLASRRLGKSFVGLGVGIELAIKTSGSINRIFSSTQKNCQDIVNDNMVIFMKLFPEGFIVRVSSLYRWKIPSTGSEIRIHPLEKGASDNTRGGSCDFALVEEAAFVDEDDLKDAIESVIIPMFLRKKKERICYISTAARSEEHWIHSTLEARCKENGTLFYATVYDNPHLDADRIEAVKNKLSVEAWHREMLCIPYTDSSRSVIPEFDYKLHVKVLPRPKFIKPISVLDFGGVRDKHGIVFGYYDVIARRKYAMGDLLLPSYSPTETVVEAVEEKEKKLFGGPLNMRCADAAGQIIVDLNSKGCVAYPPRKGQGSWESGINALKESFKNGTLYIHPSCKDLIGTIRSAIYNKNRTDWERSERYGHYDLLAALIYFNNEVDTSRAYPINWGLNPQNQNIPKHREPNTGLTLDALMEI